MKTVGSRKSQNQSKLLKKLPEQLRGLRLYPGIVHLKEAGWYLFVSTISCLPCLRVNPRGLIPALKVKLLSPVGLFVTPRTVAYQAPQSMEFSRQEYWSGFPFPSQGDLPNPGIEPRSPALQADTLPHEPPGNC